MERIHATTMELDTSDRLHGVELSEKHRARAKEDLRSAEYVVDLILSVLARIREGARPFARRTESVTR